MRQLAQNEFPVDAVFVTHEHSDHLKGVGVIGRYSGAPIYIEEKAYLLKKDSFNFKNCTLKFISAGDKIEIGDVIVEAHKTSHDSIEGLFFIVEEKKTKLRYGHLTDTGKITPKMTTALQSCDGLLLESNHDIDLLMDYPLYPDITKNRIKSNLGHLSNKQTMEFIRDNLDYNKLQWIVFGHLSKNSNSPEMVLEAKNEIIPEFKKVYFTPKKIKLKMEGNKTLKEKNTLTINEIWDMFKNGEFGIPYFQRGLVWDEPQVEMLFESLYHGYPISSIVLWELNKNENEKYVKQLNPKKDVSDVKYAIIDGQQRIRSICEELAPIFDCENHPNEKRNIWCLDLSRVYQGNEEYKIIFEKLNKKRTNNNLIKKIVSPNIQKDNYDSKGKKINNTPQIPIHLKYMLPIGNITKTHNISKLNELNELGLYFNDFEKISQEDKKLLKNEEIVNNIKKQETFVNYIEPNKDFAEVIKIYNQINSGGMRVENEELAYSKLILEEHKLKLDNHIKNIFDEIHPDEPTDLGINYYLNRQRENQFGFKFYIRVFIMVTNYHFGRSHGKSSFNFDFINNGGFSEIINNNEMDKGKSLNDLWKRTQIIIFALHKLIKGGLFCDDYRFLPSTVSLYPIIQLLIQFPELIILDEKNTLCRLIFQFQFAGYSTKEILNLVYSINQLRYNFGETIRFMDNFLSKKNKYSDFIFDIDSNGEWVFGDNTEWNDAKSVNHRYVQLMYWVQRKMKAKDFNYKENSFSEISDFEEAFTIEYDNKNYNGYYNNGLPIEKRFNPQREHLIPYSKLKEILNIGETGRVSTHKANDIGNLTFISSLLNSMYHGKGDKIMNFEKVDENLKAHFINNDIQVPFNKLKNNMEKEKEGCYDDFITQRRKLIKQGFIDLINSFNEDLGEMKMIDYEIQKYHTDYLNLCNDYKKYKEIADLIWRVFHNYKEKKEGSNEFNYIFKKMREIKKGIDNKYLILDDSENNKRIFYISLNNEYKISIKWEKKEKKIKMCAFIKFLDNLNNLEGNQKYDRESLEKKIKVIFKL